MRLTSRKEVVAASIAALVLAAVGCNVADRGRQKGDLASIAPVTVRFGMLPYGDHSYAVIGVKQGWFRELGINLEYRPVKIEDLVPFLRNGSLDAGSVPPGIIVAAYENGPGVVSFAFGDVFQGYAIMAQPGKGYKSVDEFVKGGSSISEAIVATVRQMKGKTFAYPAEAAIKPFIDLALSKGALSKDDVRSLVLDDPLTVNAMRNHQAEFEVGGVPSRLVLEREGFKPILSSKDLASAAKPSPDSEELSSIFTDGWACTREYYDKHRETVLRLASVNYRITKFMTEHPDEAIAIHMPYLSQITGQAYTLAEMRIFYTSLDPFYTFEAQKDWYHNPASVYYYKNLNGAIINSFIKQKIFKRPPPAVSDVIIADEVYRTLEEYRSKADGVFSQIDGSTGTRSETQRKQLAQARAFYEAYAYPDAFRTASAVLSGK
jgi:NitT/TauT family transport system substrate-binding protein